MTETPEELQRRYGTKDHAVGTPFDPNEPEDYDGYVDYVCGRIPGLDGKTYYDGHVDDEPEVR